MTAALRTASTTSNNDLRRRHVWSLVFLCAIRSFSSIESLTSLRLRTVGQRIDGKHFFPHSRAIYVTNYLLVQEGYNHTDKELKRYQTRVAILQHELSERVQQVSKYERRVQILQLLIFEMREATEKANRELMTKNSHQQPTSNNDYSSLQEVNRRLQLTVDQLRSELFSLEQRDLRFSNQEMHILQQALEKTRILLSQERKKSERDQRKLEAELFAANQEILKVESALFALEKEIKTKEEKWDRHESAMQQDLEQQRKINRKLKSNLQGTGDGNKRGVDSRDNATSSVFLDSDALEIAEAAVRASLQREALLTKKIESLGIELQHALGRKDTLKKQNSEQLILLHEREKSISELECLIQLHREEYRQLEEAFQNYRNSAALENSQQQGLVRRLQEEIKKSADLRRTEKQQLLADNDHKNSSCEQLLHDERKSLGLQIETLNKHLSAAKAGGDSSQKAGGDSSKASAPRLFRWFYERFKKIRNLK